jgi:hypothetical protein
MLPSLTYGDTANVTFNNVSGASLGGVYTDPYSGTISGLGNVSMVCDDYIDHITFGESWQANALSFANIAGSSQPLFIGNANKADGYAAVGYLAEQIFSNPTAAQNDYISWAIWDIMNPGVLNNLNGNTDPNWAADIATVRNLELTALANAGSLSNYSDLTLYTPDASNHAGWTDDRPQEMIVKTPEAPGFALLGLDMAGLIGLLAVLRRRIRRRE